MISNHQCPLMSFIELEKEEGKRRFVGHIKIFFSSIKCSRDDQKAVLAQRIFGNVI